MTPHEVIEQALAEWPVPRLGLATDILAALTAAGYAIVPREPTTDTLVAMAVAVAADNIAMFSDWKTHADREFRAAYQHLSSSNSGEMRAAYRAMVDAATPPTAP